MNGGKPVFVPLRAPERAVDSNISSHEWRLDVNELRSKITPKTKMIVINTPHNPVGKVFDEKELLDIGKVAEEHDLIILSDEVVRIVGKKGGDVVNVGIDQCISMTASIILLSKNSLVWPLSVTSGNAL